MDSSKPTPWTLRFSLFGIPVSIHPISWVILAILGGALGVSDGGELNRVLLFTVAGMLTLLVHEFGHALVGRALGALVERVEIAGMGGVTYFGMLPPQRPAYALILAAGPLASLLLGALAGLVFGLQLGDVWVGIRLAFLMPWMSTLPLDL